MWMSPDTHHPCKYCSMVTTLPDDSGLPRENNVPVHTAKIAQEWLEEHDKDPKALTRPPCSRDLNTIEQEDLPYNPNRAQRRTLPEILCPCPNGWQHQGDLQSIRQVVLMLSWVRVYTTPFPQSQYTKKIPFKTCIYVEIKQGRHIECLIDRDLLL